MPVRAVHHHSTIRGIHNRASATVSRMRNALRAPSMPRYPIPLLLPCEILLKVVDEMLPEAAVCLVCTCTFMRGLYCEDGIYPADSLWQSLLQRTFPTRLTGAPGPNAPPRLRGSDRFRLCAHARDWVAYCRELRAAPKLTGVQIAKFVRWASSAHSWYKHLPLQEAALFSFILDVTVGMKRTPDGYVEQHEGDARTHYSWLPTHAYRDAFGLLTYRDALPAFVADTNGPRSVAVMKSSAERTWVPGHLVEIGSCKVTAACHGRAESYQIYHHPYEAFVQASASGTLAQKPPRDSTGEGRHSYSYLAKEAQKAHFRTLPKEVLADFALLHAFQQSGQDHTVEAQCMLIQQLFPRLSAKQVAKLQDRRVWGSPWQPGGAFLGAPNICVTAQKAREWQRMFDHAAAYCEAIYGEPVDLDGVRSDTMTCLALESLPLPVYDIMST